MKITSSRDKCDKILDPPLSRTVNKCSAVAEMGDRFDTIDMCR